MKIGATNGINNAQRVYTPAQAEQRAAAAGKPAEGDRVEISGAARLRDAISQLPEVRAEKIAQAREMILSGTLDTPERLSAALDRLIEEA